MRIGLQIPYFKYPGDTPAIGPKLAEMARMADTAGFHSLWVMDHFFQLEGMIGPADDPMLEGYTTLGYLAGVTSRVRLGTLVTGNNYRHPAVLVNAVTTLDVLSSGRAYCGIGAGWYEREATALDLPFETFARRFEWLEETLQIALQMWSDDNGEFKGKRYHLRETLNSPQPLSCPHPPIMIGGTGEQKTLRMVAQYADACNIFMEIGLDNIQHKLDVLKGHCEVLGRDYSTIEKTTLGPGNLEQRSVQEMIDICGKLAEIGIDHAIFNMPNAHEIWPLETFGKEIIPVAATF